MTYFDGEQLLSFVYNVVGIIETHYVQKSLFNEVLNDFILILKAIDFMI